jgi:hypothetical protein
MQNHITGDSFDACLQLSRVPSLLVKLIRLKDPHHRDISKL